MTRQRKVASPAVQAARLSIRTRFERLKIDSLTAAQIPQLLDDARSFVAAVEALQRAFREDEIVPTTLPPTL